jgi:antitoxin HigA-1
VPRASNLDWGAGGAQVLAGLNEIIRGKRGISADTALRLARLLNTTPEFWMGLQTDWDLWHAAAAMRKAG